MLTIIQNIGIDAPFLLESLLLVLKLQNFAVVPTLNQSQLRSKLLVHYEIFSLFGLFPIRCSL